MAAAFLLVGFSLVYGVTGSIELPQIRGGNRPAKGSNPAPADCAGDDPGRLWLQGGGRSLSPVGAGRLPEGVPPAPSAALIASASKLAGFTLFTRLLGPGNIPTVAVVAAISLLLGNLAALAQTNLRRLLAYSAIAHAGALLLGVMVAGRFGPGPLFYYASTYGLATVGVFGVIAAVGRGGRCEAIADLAGLHRRSPLLAACLSVFVLSLAGIPPTWLDFREVCRLCRGPAPGRPGRSRGLARAAGHRALSAVALYYYLIILKQALVAAPATEAGPIAVPSSWPR